MLRQILCFLGFHEHKERLQRTIGKHELHEMVCIHCGHIGDYKE